MQGRPMRDLILVLATLLMVAGCFIARAEEDSPVVHVASRALRLQTPSGPVLVPYESSKEWSHPLPEITRAVILIHGLKRNVESAYRTLERAASDSDAAARNTVLITPQFLNKTDLSGYSLPKEVLRWQGSNWDSGYPATDPAPVSAYDVLDALIQELCRKSIFPNLTTIVIAGHSAGGQIVQRYAVVGRALSFAASQGVRVRLVAANPSSYLYFTDERPLPTAPPFQFARFTDVNCATFNHWKYGLENPPPYIVGGAAQNWKVTEDDYARREVIYLLGTADNDPHHAELDKSCAGEAQGPHRFFRGQAYYAWLHARHPAEWNQHLWFVPGVAHSAEDIFTSKCGLAALFDHDSCRDQ